MSDQMLEQAVKSALRQEPFIDSERIVVTVHGGVAKLAGEVESRTQKMVARYKAQCVRGVSDVHDELDVRTPNRVEQRVNDIETGVMNALFWDAAVPTERVSAKCEKGWVTLTGEVERPYQRSCAEADVRNIRGVMGVTNEIKVSRCSVQSPSREGEIAQTGQVADPRAGAEGRPTH